ASDVYTTPIFMKKNRPGVLLGVIAPTELVAELESILFRETATFGIRKHAVQRNKLAREACIVETPFGAIRGKKGVRNRMTIITPEYDDCARVAREQNVPLREVMKLFSDASKMG